MFPDPFDSRNPELLTASRHRRARECPTDRLKIKKRRHSEGVREKSVSRATTTAIFCDVVVRARSEQKILATYILAERLQQLKEGSWLNLAGVAEAVGDVEVEHGRDAAEHLKDEGLAMQNVELLADELDRATEQPVRLVVAVDADDGGHDKQVAVIGEDVLKLERRVDEGRHAEAKHGAVLAVQDERAVDDVEEEMDIGRLGEEAGGRLKHAADESHPNDLVQRVHAQQLLAHRPNTLRRVESNLINIKTLNLGSGSFFPFGSVGSALALPT